MKRFLFSMAALLAVVGCAKQEDLVSADFGATDAPEFTVSFEASRVAIAEDGEGYKLSWNNDDRLSIFFNEGGNSEFRFDGETGTTSGKIVAVEGKIKDGALLDTFYGVYPYGEDNSLSGDVLSLTLPAVQAYAEGTFAEGSNTMVAEMLDKGDFNFQFYNVGGYIRLNVTGEATITSIELKGNNDEVLAGAATYDMSSKTLAITGEGKTITMDCGEGIALSAEPTTIWVVVPPTTFEEGLTVTLTDSEGNSMEKVLDEAFTIERNTVYNGDVAYTATPAIGEMLLDITFDANGAVNNGTVPGIVIEDKNHSTIQVGDKYVGKFIKPNNSTAPQTEGFYYINYSNNEALQAALEDGFTMDVILRSEFVSIMRYSKAVGANTWGLNHDHNHYWWDNPAEWNFYANMPVTENMGGIAAGKEHLIMGSYEQVTFVYDPINGYVRVYANGRTSLNAILTSDGIDPGKALAIGAGAFNTCDGTAVDRFNGEIYAVRIYNTPKSEEEVKALYEETLPTVQALNTNVLDAMPNVVFDLKFDAEGNATDAAGNATFEKYGEYSVAPAPAGWTENQYVGKFNEKGYLIGTASETLCKTLSESFTLEAITTNYKVNVQQCLFSTDSWNFAMNAYKNYEVYIDNDGNPDTNNGWFRMDWCRYVHTPNQYYHIVMSYDKATHKTIVSVNGWPGFVYEKAAGVTNPTTKIWVGGNYGELWKQPYAGDIVSLKVYDRALSREEIGVRYRHFYDGCLDAMNATF